MTIGIDPGLTGAISFINGTGYSVHDLPVMANGKGSAKVKNCIDPAGLKKLIETWCQDGFLNKPEWHARTDTVYLERISSMPGQGVATMFSMGDTFGSIRSVCAVMGFRVEIVLPKQWKQHHKLTKDKEIARAKAIQLFPKAELHRKKDHNRAEALLIAEYGRHLENSGQ